MDSPLQHIKSSIQGGHVFDVDERSGFMAPEPPIARLPESWNAWETALECAIAAKLQTADKVGLTTLDASTSREWRACIREVRFPSRFCVLWGNASYQRPDDRCQRCPSVNWRPLPSFSDAPISSLRTFCTSIFRACPSKSQYRYPRQYPCPLSAFRRLSISRQF